jgi:predicted nucleic acid-binding protein
VILVDASVLLAAEDRDDRNHSDASSLLRSTEPLATLDLAFYEVTNVADVVWQDPIAGARIRRRVSLIAADGGLVRVDDSLADHAAALAAEFAISAYDGAYVAAARLLGATLASCDVRDLVGNGLAELPAQLV